jgi:hypothetical protein
MSRLNIALQSIDYVSMIALRRLRYADCVTPIALLIALPAFHPSEVDSDRTNRIDIEPPVASSLNQHPTLRPCTLMDVLNGLHIEPDDHESKPISKGIDLRKPATEHDLTSLSRNKLTNLPPKAKSFLRRSYD